MRPTNQVHLRNLNRIYNLLPDEFTSHHIDKVYRELYGRPPQDNYIYRLAEQLQKHLNVYKCKKVISSTSGKLISVYKKHKEGDKVPEQKMPDQKIPNNTKTNKRKTFSEDILFNILESKSILLEDAVVVLGPYKIKGTFSISKT